MSQQHMSIHPHPLQPRDRFDGFLLDLLKWDYSTKEEDKEEEEEDSKEECTIS